MASSTSPAEQRQALLGDDSESEAWSRVERQPPKCGPSVRELVASKPETVIETLQKSGVQEVAQFCLPDKLVLGRLGNDRIATMGAAKADLDYPAAWRHELGSCCRRGAPPDDWCSDIPVLAYVVSIRDAAAPGGEGLLQPLIRRWQAGGCNTSTFQLPALAAVIDWKWSFCRRILIAELCLYLAWLASFFAFALAYGVEDGQLSMAALLATHRGRLAVVSELLGLAAMLPFLYAEACTALAYRSGFLDLWKLLDLATYSLQVLIVVLHMGRLAAGASIIPVAAAAQCVLLLFRLQFFSRVFPATRFAFVDDLKEVLHDMKWYLIFLVLVMAGFATAFLVLFRANSTAAGGIQEEFSGLGKAFVTMVSWVAGDPNLTLLYKPQVAHPLAACLLGISYIFVFTLVLMTLLVGLMTNTLQKVTKDEEARMLLSKALIIDELESTAPSLLHRLWPAMHPRYLHVLRINPARLDAVELDRLWKSMSDEDAQEMQGRSALVASSAAAATPTQPQQAQQAAAEEPPPAPPHQLMSASIPDSAPLSLRWRGSLLDAYLGNAESAGSPNADALMYQRALLGGEGTEDAMDVAAAVAATSSEVSALREELREMKQLLVAALSGSGGGAGASGRQ